MTWTQLEQPLRLRRLPPLPSTAPSAMWTDQLAPCSVVGWDLSAPCWKLTNLFLFVKHLAFKRPENKAKTQKSSGSIPVSLATTKTLCSYYTCYLTWTPKKEKKRILENRFHWLQIGIRSTAVNQQFVTRKVPLKQVSKLFHPKEIVWNTENWKSHRN